MTLIVSRRPNGGYNGKHKAAATAMVKSGKRVGMVHIDPSSCTFFCHICKKDRPLPKECVDQKETVDHFSECSGCKTPFIFASA